MRTSTSQFDLMVTFMEQHGDLSKPSNNARGRMTALQLWEQLASMLNADGSGDSKATEKWKKVWSDYKNNCKKKAARLYKSVSGTGGGPAIFSKLSDLEQRVLNLIGVQVATGLAVEEAGVSQGNETDMVVIDIQESGQDQEVAIQQPPTSNQILNCSQPWNEAGPSTRAHIAPPINLSQEILTSHNTIAPGDTEHNEVHAQVTPFLIGQRFPISSPPRAFSALEVDETLVTPTRALSPCQDHTLQPQPSHTGRTPTQRVSQPPPPRAQRSRPRRSPRRIIRPSHTEQASRHFLQSDEEWRKFKMSQHRDYMNLRREQNRIRELEVRAQMNWQALGHRGLDLIEKVVNKFCHD